MCEFSSINKTFSCDTKNHLNIYSCILIWSEKVENFTSSVGGLIAAMKLHIWINFEDVPDHS